MATGILFAAEFARLYVSHRKLGRGGLLVTSQMRTHFTFQILNLCRYEMSVCFRVMKCYLDFQAFKHVKPTRCGGTWL